MVKRMAITGEVKIRIISNALSLEAFTVAQMRRATGLNPRSIQTVLQRLKRQGYLTSEPVKEAPPGSRRPPHRYRLTPDADKRLELARQVEAFYTPPPKPAPSEPTSRHYTSACRFIERLEREKVAEAEKAAAVEKIHHHLKLTASEEGLDVRRDTQGEILAAHLALLRARLAMSQGHWAEAERNLEKATDTFSAHGLDDLLARTKDLQGELRVRRALIEAPGTTPTEAVIRLLTESPNARLSLPTVCALLQQAERLAAPQTALAGSTDRMATLLCDAFRAWQQVAGECVTAGYPTDDSIDELHRASGVLNAELAIRQQGRQKLQCEFMAAMAAVDRKEAARTLPPAEIAASADSIPLEEIYRQIGQRSR